MRLADYVMNRLADEGIKYVFQVTGRGSLFLSDALSKQKSLTSISLHHEQSCSYAAIASASSYQDLGACLVSTGCASTNAITGVLCAWQDGLPVVFISGQNILNETSYYSSVKLRTYGQQENNIIDLVTPITKYATMITEPLEIVDELEKAIYMAKEGRKGPVWIDIPLDLQSSIIDDDSKPIKFSSYDTPTLVKQEESLVWDSLSVSSKPVFLIGSGVASANASQELKHVSEKYQIPVVFSHSSPDTYSTINQLSLGPVGTMGCSRAANMAIANSDLIIVIGSRLSSITTGQDFCKFGRYAKKIVIDLDPNEHEKRGIDIDHFIRCDALKFLQFLDSRNPECQYSDWVRKCVHWKSIFMPVEASFISEDRVDLYQLAQSLSTVMPESSIMVTDSGLCEVILPTNVSFPYNSKCIHSASQGAMGFALPASIGAQLSHPESLVIAVIGDGSFMMNIQELQSIRYLELPIKLIIINNNVYSIIRRRQRELFRRRLVGTDPSNGISCPDFKKVASCFDFSYTCISSPHQLDDQLGEFFRSQGPSICEIIGRDDQSYIEASHARCSNSNKFVRRPLEDQAPFLSRELFLSEMIVPAIDQ